MKKKWYIPAIAGILVVAIICGTVFWPEKSLILGNARVLAEAEYPTAAPYPDESKYEGKEWNTVWDTWWEERETRYQQAEAAGDLDAFILQTMAEFLNGEDGENKVYSPLNVYMALSMLAELTDGNSRDQVLTLLGVESIEELRKKASNLWNAHYRNDGAVTSTLASSLWLNENITFHPETMETLAKTYYASSYEGTPGTGDFDQALRDWLNEQTGGLLQEQIQSVKMNPETVLTLATTIYYRAKWDSAFSEISTAKRVFHTADGDISCDFMNQQTRTNYYWGDQFSAVCKDLTESGGMWLILPDEGVDVNDLLTDGQVQQMLLGENRENSKNLLVNLSVPKFDVTSGSDLIPGLKNLGVTDVFDPAVSDFTPTCDEDELYVSAVQHDARVTIDEEGCTATAFTVITADASSPAPPKDEVDFVVDRPFLFVITSEHSLPLFMGIVQNPS
ncbi:MAG: hypothetical protein IJ333_09590 [Clostridia bacterium]|nr:hypothetical protein [Clostridia bacterium]